VLLGDEIEVDGVLNWEEGDFVEIVLEDED